MISPELKLARKEDARLKREAKRAPSNSELYEFLRDCLDDNGVPVMDHPTFKMTTDKYSKEVFRSTLAKYITDEKPPFPLKKWDDEKRDKKFNDLSNYDYRKFIMPDERHKDDGSVRKTSLDVMEKYDDYKYNYQEHGIGVISGSAQFNYISDSFMNEQRLRCGSYGFEAAITRWEQGLNVWGALGAIWRKVNKAKYNNPELTDLTYEMTFRLGTYIATQFKPTVAKTIYDMTNAKTVLDTSMGWGDRLTGFYCSNATHYIGCDPNPNTFKIYKEMETHYNTLTDNTKTIDIYRCGAEDLWKEYEKRHGKKLDNVDVAFTSPPYFSTEEYNKGGEFQEDQSWARYNEYDAWEKDFYLKVSQMTFDSLNDKGVMMINILDPQVKGVRYKSGEALVDMLKDNFLGQVGMRIQQRPMGVAKFSKINEKGETVHDKEAMNAYMKKIYVENVWTFSKDKTLKGLTLNKMIPKWNQLGTLERFI